MLALVPGFAQTPKTAPKAAKKAAPAKTAPASPPAAPQKRPIASVSVEGNKIFTRDQVLAVSGLKVGQPAGKAEFEAARDRLVACGAFESVAYRYAATPNGEGIAATLEVSEVEQVYPVDFQDLHVSSLELDSVLRAKDPLYSREKLPATKPVLDRYTKWIQDFLATKGNHEKILGEVAQNGTGGDFAIVFRPAKPLPTIAQVTFEGNQAIAEDKLREAIVGAVGANYTEDSFRQTLGSVIRPLYEAKGYLKVRFPELQTKPADGEVKGLHVFVTINEGVTYELGKTVIDGPTPVPADTLVKAAELKSGELADMSKVNEGVERVRKAVRREGYVEARVLADRKLDDEKKQVNVSMRVDPGPQFTMGKLTIKGLDINGEAEVRRIWNLKEGKPFNPEYPDGFLRRIREMGLFDNLGGAKAEYQINQRDRSADVTLTFAGTGPAPGRGRGGRGRGGDGRY